MKKYPDVRHICIGPNNGQAIGTSTAWLQIAGSVSYRLSARRKPYVAICPGSLAEVSKWEHSGETGELDGILEQTENLAYAGFSSKIP